MSLSRAERWASLPPEDRAAFMARFYPTPAARAALRWDRGWWGRPEQIWVPGPEMTTLFSGGRGAGKSWTGSHACHYVGNRPELCGGRPARGPDDKRAGAGALMGIAGRTANDVNQTMVDGDSGIMNVCDPALRPEWNKRDCTLTWKTGVKARLMSGDVPASFRGPNFGFLWADELPHWSRVRESWKTALYALRKASRGQHPRALVTTTPLGIAEILALAFLLRDGMPIKAPPGTDPADIVQGYLRNPNTRVIQCSSFANRAHLSERFLTDTLGQFVGTADWEQEGEGLIRIGVPGALWVQDWFHRDHPDDPAPERYDRVGVFVDPTVSDGQRVKRSDEICECGIIGAGFQAKKRKMFLLRDRSLVARPSDWAAVVVKLACEIGAHEIVAEDNQGGAMVREVVLAAWERRDPAYRTLARPAIKLVHAHGNKSERAAFAAPAWEAGKVVHVGPARRWISLERQQTTYDPNRPHDHQQCDRMDAAVWGALHYLGDGTDRVRVNPYTAAEAWARLAQMAPALIGLLAQKAYGGLAVPVLSWPA